MSEIARRRLEPATLPRYYGHVEVAAITGLTRAGVSNAYSAGRLLPAAWAGDRPLFDDLSIENWRANRYRHGIA